MEKLYSIVCHIYKGNTLIDSDVINSGLSLEEALEACPPNYFTGEFSLKYNIE